MNQSDFRFFDKGQLVSLRDGFGRAMVALASVREDFYLFDADVQGGTGAKPFAQAYPERVVQFGIAEQNVMAAAAGFASVGLMPVVVGFSAFTIMRAHEMLRTAVCYGKRNVKICCSHLGVDTGPDGATAQMLEDLATCRVTPTLDVVVPACANEIQPMLAAVLDHPGPVYMRIGRSPTRVLYDEPGEVRVGKADVLRDGEDVALVACGSRVAACLDAAKVLADKGIGACVVNLRSLKPIDADTITRCCLHTGAFVTVEDHSIYGGMGSAVCEVVAQTCPVPVEILGVRDRFGRSGEHYELNELYGIGVSAIVTAAEKACSRKRR